MLTYLIYILISFFLNLTLTGSLLKVSDKTNLFKSKEGVCVFGGLGILLSFFLSFLYFHFFSGLVVPYRIFYILFFSFLIFIVGFIDDYREFSLRRKIILQIIFGVIFLIYGKPIQIYFLPSWVNYFISFLWIMGITNVFNLLDIEDGFCGGISFMASFSFLIVLILKAEVVTASLFAFLCGSLFAFLLFNLPPAKILMGNSGSHFLGFIFATLSMEGDYATEANPYALLIPLLILAFPLLDTFYLIIVRIRKGIIPLFKSKDHIFLRLLKNKEDISWVLSNVYLVNFFWSVSGIFLIFAFDWIFMLMISLSIFFSADLIVKANRAK